MESDGVGPVAVLVVLLVWVAATVTAGALLARLAVFLRPGYSFSRLWVLYSGISAVLAGLLYVILDM